MSYNHYFYLYESFCFQDKMESSLFFLSFYQDILNQLQGNNHYHRHQEYIKFIVICSYKDLDDHATSQFQHKGKVES